eukprot:512641_1
MGNSIKVNENELQWGCNKAKSIKIHEHFGKVYAVWCGKMYNDDNSILIASASQDGKLQISKLSITLTAGNKIKKTKSKLIAAIPLRTNWVMTTNVSPSLNFIASGGLDNEISIYSINPNLTNQWIRDPLYILQKHTGYISDIQFINDKYILSSSGDGTLLLWDIQLTIVIDTLKVPNNVDITSIDYIYLHERHIIVYCTIDSGVQNKIFVEDITEILNKYEHNETNINNDDIKTENNDNILSEYLWNMDNIKYMVEPQTFGSVFNTDVNNVKFSPNGMFIAACSDDGTYAIYYRIVHYDHWWNIKKIEWVLLCQRNFSHLLYGKNEKNIDEEKQINNENRNENESFCGMAITFPDNHTVMISTDTGSDVFVSQIKEQKHNTKLADAIKFGVKYIISKLPFMKWIGLANDIACIILLYFNEFDTFDYHIKPKGDSQDRISCLASCKWGINEQNSIVITGCWDKKVEALISIKQYVGNEKRRSFLTHFR